MVPGNRESSFQVLKNVGVALKLGSGWRPKNVEDHDGERLYHLSQTVSEILNCEEDAAEGSQGGGKHIIEKWAKEESLLSTIRIKQHKMCLIN